MNKKNQFKKSGKVWQSKFNKEQKIKRTKITRVLFKEFYRKQKKKLQSQIE
jgi:hypothetical protein